jgi:hypothetical protein
MASHRRREQLTAQEGVGERQPARRGGFAGEYADPREGG